MLLDSFEDTFFIGLVSQNAIKMLQGAINICLGSTVFYLFQNLVEPNCSPK